MSRTLRTVLFATIGFASVGLLWSSIEHRWDGRGQNGPLISELQHAQTASICYVTEPQDWGYIYSNSLLALNFYVTPGFGVVALRNSEDSEQHRKLLALLRQSTGIHSSPPDPQQHGGFIIVTHQSGWHGSWAYESAPHYAYISKTGELGRGHEWVYVPKEFKEWMDTLKPIRPAPPKFTGIVVEGPQWPAYVNVIIAGPVTWGLIVLVWFRNRTKRHSR